MRAPSQDPTTPPRRGTRGAARAGLAAAAVVGVTAGVIVALALFQPWKLFVDTTVDEALPEALTATAPPSSPTSPPTSATPATPTTPTPPTPTPPTPTPTRAASTTVLGQGTFRSFEHRTTGTALLVRLADGRALVRLERLATSDGPDVHVWLSPAQVAAGEDAFPAGHVELGVLKGNLGNQNYALPAGLDPSRFRSVVIWCERFSVAFAAADLR